MAFTAQVKADALAWLQAHRQGFVHTVTYREGIKDPETGKPVYADIVDPETQEVTGRYRTYIERTIKGVDPREVAYALFIWARETGVLGDTTFPQIEDYVNEKLGNIMNLDRHHAKTHRTKAQIEALVVANV